MSERSAESTHADEDVCGETYDHDEQETYRDEEVYQWVCRRCGAEGFEDLDEMTTPPGEATP